LASAKAILARFRPPAIPAGPRGVASFG